MKLPSWALVKLAATSSRAWTHMVDVLKLAEAELCTSVNQMQSIISKQCWKLKVVDARMQSVDDVRSRKPWF